jgi:hypothetical protein
MGVIYDRSSEHLGTSDAFIIRMRHRLVHAAKALEEQGNVPDGVDNPEIYRVRAVQVVSPDAAPWLAATRELCQVTPGRNPGGAELGLVADDSVGARPIGGK